MADTIPCFGCSTPLANEPGNYYCPTCVAKQQAEQGNEREVFDAYMRWADQQGGIVASMDAALDAAIDTELDNRFQV